MSSLTLGGTLNQLCTVYSIKGADEFGNGHKRIDIAVNRPCRFVLEEQRRFDSSAGGYIRLGSAAAWLDGRIPVQVGDVFVDLESGHEYRIKDVAMPRDLFSVGVDHTKIILE